MTSAALVSFKSAKVPRAGRTSEQQAAYEESVRWALRSYAPADIERMDDDAVSGLKAALGHGTSMYIWETGVEYMPMATPAKRSVDLREQILRYLPVQHQSAFRAARLRGKHRFGASVVRLMDQAVGKMLRLMLLMRFGPAGVGSKGKYKPLDVTTIATAATHALPMLFALALRKHLQPNVTGLDDQRFLSILNYGELDELPSAVIVAVRREVDRLQILADRGLWSDVVQDVERTSGTTAVEGDAPLPAAEDLSEPHLPLPDEYVSQMGVHCHWVIEQFAPAMLAVAERVKVVWEQTEDLSSTPGAVKQRRHDRIRDLLAAEVFRDAKAREIRDLPFRSQQAPWWPMRTYRDFAFGMRLVQMAHYFVVGLPLAGRKGELGTLKRDCIHYTDDGQPFATGRTWKLVENIAGARREYQLPDFSAFALEQQLRLVKLMEEIGGLEPRRIRLLKPGNHLWAEMGTGKADCRKPLVHASYALQWFADALGMTKAPGGQGIRVHRFRKTIARLAALAMSDAPKVLMDVFGHKDIEMTLHYILTDKDLQSDIERVEREIRVAKARQAVTTIIAKEEAVDHLPHAGYGGPQALILEEAIEDYGAHLHRQGKDWNAQTVEEFVEIQTLGGKSWVVVRPGVVCTKFPLTEAGRCNQSRGKPDSSRCQSHCRHRLEEPFLREDVESSISRCVEGFFKSKAEGQDLVQSSWVAQLKIQLPRFADICERWKATAEVQEMLAFDAEEGEEVMA
jgi:integrase